MGGGGAIKYARIDVLDGEGEGTSRVDETRLEPHVEPLQRHLGGKLGSDGVIDSIRDSIRIDVLLDSGSGVTSISEDLA